MFLKRCLVGLAIAAASASASPRAASSESGVADAAMHREREAVRSLLKAGADVNAAQGDGMTALHWAARHGDAELARLIVYAGANLKATTRLGGYTPLLMASQQGDTAIIDVLLKAGADPKAATTNGTTPLMFAAAAGSADAVTLLLDRGADPHAKESARGETALMFAAAFGRVEAMKVLLARGADVKVTTKVVDVKTLTNAEEEAFLRAQAAQRQGAPRAPGAEPAVVGGYAASVARPAGARAEPEPTNTPGAATRPAEARSGEAKPDERRPAEGARPDPASQIAGVSRQFRFAELVSTQGGLAPLHFAIRQGHTEAATLLVESGADVNQVTAGDHTSPLLMAVINGHFDLAQFLLDRGADPKLASHNGVTPLYAALNVQWAPKALYPQPRAYTQQKLTYLDLMTALLKRGVDVNARLKKKVWYSGYNFDLSGVDEIGATAFWRAAYASDVEAMKLLVAHGADPNISTIKPAGRPRTGDGGREVVEDVSGLPPVPIGGPGVTPLQAATGVGYGEGFAANSHRNAPSGWMPAVRYLVEEMGVDVDARDHEGNTALHHAAARGDNEMILYLVSKGADVKAVNRAGETTADMANGPVQRIQPFPEALALLEKLGAKNNNKCKSC
jgi:ankyrin repeat protein